MAFLFETGWVLSTGNCRFCQPPERVLVCPPDRIWLSCSDRTSSALGISDLIHGLPWWLRGQQSACSAGAIGDPDLIPQLGRSLEGGHGNSLQYCCLETPHGQRSLAGYSSWGRKELDTAEQLSTTQQQ